MRYLRAHAPLAAAVVPVGAVRALYDEWHRRQDLVAKQEEDKLTRALFESATRCRELERATLAAEQRAAELERRSEELERQAFELEGRELLLEDRAAAFAAAPSISGQKGRPAQNDDPAFARPCKLRRSHSC